MGRPVQFKNAIYQAAARLFGEQGLDGTSIRQIAEAAGVSEAALYRHWKDKVDLAWEVFRSGLRTLQESLEQEVCRDRGAYAAIESAVQCFYRLFDDNKQLFGFVLLHQHDLWSRMNEETQSPVRFWLDLIKTFTANLPQEEQAHPDVVAAVTLGIVLRPPVARLYGRISGPMVNHAPIVARAVCRVLYIDLQ